ncbi:MAG: hypothetical protein AB7P02_23465 [Alphaproteobacteria bacterium]
MRRALPVLLSLAALASSAAAQTYEMCLDIDPGLTAIVLHVGTEAYSRASLADEKLSTCFNTEATGWVSVALYRPGSPWVACNEFIASNALPTRIRFAITKVIAGTAAAPPTIACARI